MNFPALARSLPLAALLGLAALPACSDPDSDPPSDTSSTTTQTTTSSGGGGGGGGGAAQVSWVAQLDATKGQLPEGLAVSAAGDKAFVGLAPTGEILSIALPGGSVSPHGSVPPPPPNAGYLLGLALDAAGNLYAGVASTSATYPPGVYKVPAGGGVGTLFASHDGLLFPNGLTFDDGGSLYVTDSLSGVVFKVGADGQAAPWASDPLLVGDVAGPCAAGAGFPIGANGIVISGGAVFVVNTDHGAMVKIPIKADGTADQPSTFVASDCSTLGGADGLALDAKGHFFVAANAINGITEVTPSGVATVLVSGEGLDFPASLAVITKGGHRTVIVTNAALKSAQTPGATPHPGLLQVTLED